MRAMTRVNVQAAKTRLAQLRAALERLREITDPYR